MIRRQRALAVRADAAVVEHGADGLIEISMNLLISCEVRNPSKKCRKGMRASSVAVCAIRRGRWPPARSSSRAWQSPWPAGHDVGVIAENRERMRGQGAGRYVNARGGEFAGDLVHVGNHQQQSLRGGECGAESAPACRRRAPPRRRRLRSASHHCGTLPQIFLRPSADHWSAHSPMGDEGVMG